MAAEPKMAVLFPVESKPTCAQTLVECKALESKLTQALQLKTEYPSYLMYLDNEEGKEYTLAEINAFQNSAIEVKHVLLEMRATTKEDALASFERANKFEWKNYILKFYFALRTGKIVRVGFLLDCLGAYSTFGTLIKLLIAHLRERDILPMMGSIKPMDTNDPLYPHDDGWNEYIFASLRAQIVPKEQIKDLPLGLVPVRCMEYKCELRLYDRHHVVDNVDMQKVMNDLIDFYKFDKV
jgi:hypothetical protein